MRRILAIVALLAFGMAPVAVGSGLSHGHIQAGTPGGPAPCTGMFGSVKL